MLTDSPKKWLQYLTVFIKLVFVPYAFGMLIIHIVDDSHLELLDVTPWMVIAGLAINQFALTLFALRMRIFLGVFGIRISQWQAVRIHLQSMFYFFALPMTFGLEAARYAKIKGVSGNEAQPILLSSALLADRLMGALAALLLAMLLLPFMNFNLPSHWDVRYLLALSIMFVGVIAFASLSNSLRFYFREFMRLLKSGRKGLWLGMVVSIATHVFFALGIYLAINGGHLQITFFQTLFIVSGAMLFIVIPVSFAGVSPVEAATIGVLLGLGVPVEQALIFVLFAYLAKLVAAFEGGLWEMYEGGAHLRRHLFGE